jgi:hypothetical protein
LAGVAITRLGLDVAHAVDPLASLFGRQLAGHGLDHGIGEVLLQLGGHVVGGGHITAEHHGRVAILQERADMGHERGELGVACRAREPLGRGDEGLQALGTGLVLQLGGRLQVEARQVFSGAVVQVIELGIVVRVVVPDGQVTFQPRVQGLGSGGRRRSHAAQQGQRGVPDETGAALVAGALHGLGQLAAIGLHVVEEAAPAPLRR